MFAHEALVVEVSILHVKLSHNFAYAASKVLAATAKPSIFPREASSCSIARSASGAVRAKVATN